MQTFRCIWCTAEKAAIAFNAEHVIPRSFGTFEENLTLVYVVCKECNDFFATNLEPSLARDSLEGFDRFRYGLKPPDKFSSLGKRSTTRLQIAEGPDAGAWAFTPKGDSRAVSPFPQIGFATTAEGPFEWHMLDDVPSLEELKSRGYLGECHIKLIACTQEAVADLLADKGFKPSYRGTTQPPRTVWVDQVFRPTLLHRRALAKIAFNYFAKQHGADVALEARFDWIRDLVLRGNEPTTTYYTIDEEAVVPGDKKDGKKLFGHFLVTEVRNGAFVATVSLYNRFRHRITLAAERATHQQGHYFDIESRRIIVLADIAALLATTSLGHLPYANVLPLPPPDAMKPEPTEP